MAIDDLLDEHEQGELVRTWLRRNSGSLIGGIALGLALIAGWQWWKGHQASQAQQAAAQYEAQVAGSADPAKAAAGLARLPADSTYGALARMQLAKTQVDGGKPGDALATLRQIHVRDPGLMYSVNVRIARLLVDTDKPADALAQLKGLTGAGVDEATGDAQAALKHTAEAQAAYKRALTSLPVGSSTRTIVELKLEDVGGTVATSGDTAP